MQCQTNNEVEEILVSTMNNRKKKEETEKRKKVYDAWEHFIKIMVNGTKGKVHACIVVQF